MRILFLHEVNYLEKPIFEMHEFPEHLADRGHQVGFVQFPEGWDKSKVRAQGFKSNIQGRVVSESQITLYTPQIAAGTFFGRLLTALRFGSVFKKVLEDFKPEVVVSFSVPTSGWQALSVAKKQGIPFVFRALDVSHRIRKNFLTGLVYLAEKFIYRNADRVSANNPAMANYCISMGAQASKVSIDFPPIDLSHFRGAVSNREEMRKQLGLTSEDQVFVYMGSFFYFSGLPEFIEEFAKNAMPNQRLVLIGGGEQEQELRKLVEARGLTGSVIFTGFVTFQDLPKYLGVADVAINTMQKSLVSNAAFPNKVIQYMASGLPVVLTDLDGLRLTFAHTPGLRLVDSPEQVFTDASEMLKNSGLSELGANNQEKLAKIFSREGAVSSFEELLVKAIGKNGL